MAKGAANEGRLGTLHSKITEVFIQVLERYETRLDLREQLSTDDLQEEILAKLLDMDFEPNPAMLSAITKFLKDNEISFDTEQLEQLSDQERRLKERREKRGSIASLSTLKVVGDG